MGPDEDDPSVGSKGVYGRSGKSTAGEIGVIRHGLVVAALSLIGFVVGTVGFLTEPGMFECMGMSEVCAVARFKFVVPECAVDVGVPEDKDSERGHVALSSEISRVFIHS